MRFVIVALIGLIAQNTFASQTGNLTLRGTVAALFELSVVPNNNLTLNIKDGETNKAVADVTETCNNPSGYKIKVSSATGGFLENTTDSSKKTSYQLGYDGNSPVTLSVSGSYLKTVNSLSNHTVSSSNVVVNVKALPKAVSGDYEDTVTFTIEAH